MSEHEPDHEDQSSEHEPYHEDQSSEDDDVAQAIAMLSCTGGNKRALRAAIGQHTVRIISRGKYRSANDWVDVEARVSAAVDGTTMRTPPHQLTFGSGRATQIEVVEEGTLGAALRLHRAGHNVVALNFASARNPGGGFQTGAEAQEENLARNSCLYACLTSPAAAPYYELHNAQRDPLYTHNCIYSPQVPVIRDEMSGRLLDEPWPLSFVTAAAPNAGAARKKKGASDALIMRVLAERAEVVLRMARAHGHTAIVLGAWGCGVFQNNPAAVAHAFATLLRGPFAGEFQQVTFAILGPITNRTPFEDAFGAVGPGQSSRPRTGGAGPQHDARSDARTTKRGGDGQRSRSIRGNRRASERHFHGWADARDD